MLPFAGMAQNAEVLFSANGGFYEDVFELEMFSTAPQGRIFYTTNGNRPTVQSQLYTEPILLDTSMYSKSDIYTIQISPDDLVFVPDSVQHCIVIRAAVFDEHDNCISEVKTNSYFIRALGCNTHDLPVVSLCADSLDLFDYERGIMVPGAWYDPLDPNWSGNYYQSGREWERWANVEFYELDNTGINQQAGVRTHGGNGRRFQQKALKIYAREEYGKKRFKHEFFETIPNNNFKRLVLKPFASSWNDSGVNDHICNQIAAQLDVESLASRPVLMFLNGEYWGIYYIHEKPDERYLEDHFDVDIEKVNIISGWNPIVDYGSVDNFEALIEWVEQNDLTEPAAWDYFTNQIDINNFIDYQILELFIENNDWPANNMRCWQVDDGKWRWIFYDGDACLNWMTYNAFDNSIYVGDSYWPSSTRSTLFFRKLLENDAFKETFIDRFDQLLGTVFQYSVTEPFFEDVKAKIEPEIPFQVERFGIPNDLSKWTEAMGNLQWFLMKRAVMIVERINEFMNIPELLSGRCYPNPSSGEIHLCIETHSFMGVEICIYDMMGRKVFAQQCLFATGENRVTINPQLPSGIYFLKVGTLTQKIICY